MRKNADTRELNKAYNIYDPWNAVTVERELWTLTLKSGKQVTIAAPLGAAVELELAGFAIVAS